MESKKNSKEAIAAVKAATGRFDAAAKDFSDWSNRLATGRPGMTHAALQRARLELSQTLCELVDVTAGLIEEDGSSWNDEGM